MSNVVKLEDWRVKKCAEVPTSEHCTTRLLMGHCPGVRQGVCVSPKFDPTVHNQQLPLFFAAQQ
jgi:hypothetical protein